MGPEPIKNKIVAAIKVVMLASSIVVLDFVYPESKAIIVLFSLRNSSLILSNIKTFASTAMPTVKIIPAMPGNVKVASNIVSIPIKINKFEIKDTIDIIPKNFYLNIIKITTKQKPTIKENIPASIES